MADPQAVPRRSVLIGRLSYARTECEAETNDLGLTK